MMELSLFKCPCPLKLGIKVLADLTLWWWNCFIIAAAEVGRTRETCPAGAAKAGGCLDRLLDSCAYLNFSVITGTSWV